MGDFLFHFFALSSYCLRITFGAEQSPNRLSPIADQTNPGRGLVKVGCILDHYVAASEAGPKQVRSRPRSIIVSAEIGRTDRAPRPPD